MFFKLLCQFASLFMQNTKYMHFQLESTYKGEDDLSYWTCVQSQLLYVAIKICSNQKQVYVN